MRIKNLVLIGVLAITATACGGDDDDTAAPTQTPTAAGNTVQATDELKFEPGTLSVTTGTTVTWQSGPNQPHDATSKAGAPESFKVQLPAGKSGSFTFTKAGTYPYYCTIHGDAMSGTIVVQ